jgi:haloalkane dehalogenase
VPSRACIAATGGEGVVEPFLTAFSDGDPISRGADRPLRDRIPGARGQPHTVIAGAGHFLQEDRPEELVALLDAFARGALGPPRG